MSIRVVAQKMGYYKNKRRRPGEEFEFEFEGKESELGKWMVKVADQPAAEGGLKPASADEVIASLPELEVEALEVLKQAEEAKGKKARRSVLEAIDAEIASRNPDSLS